MISFFVDIASSPPPYYLSIVYPRRHHYGLEFVSNLKICFVPDFPNENTATFGVTFKKIKDGGDLVHLLLG
jgi:hypothetical protein